MRFRSTISIFSCLLISFVGAVPTFAASNYYTGRGMNSDASNADSAAARTNLAVGGAVPVHQNAGGDIVGWGPSSAAIQQLLRSDANMPLLADIIYWIDRDPSLATAVTVSGTPTVSESVGVDCTVSSTVYHERYTVQAGDTTHAVALGIGNAINGDTTGLLAALTAYRVPDNGGFSGDGSQNSKPYQTPVANQTSGAATVFDMPYGTSCTAVSGLNTTVTVSGINGASVPGLDGGNSLIMEREIPGWVPTAGSLGPQIVFQGPLTSANHYVVLGAVSVNWLDPSHAALQLKNSSGDLFNLYNGFAQFNNSPASASYYLKVLNSTGNALFGSTGNNAFIQSGGTGEIQAQVAGGGLGTFDAATYKVNGSQITTAALADTVAPTAAAPALAFGGGNTGITYGGANAGVYTQIGKHVTWQFELVLTSKGTSTGAAQIALPVNVNTTAPAAGSCAVWSNFSAADAVNLVIGGSNNSHADVYYVPTSGGVAGAADTNFTNTTTLYCSASYVAQ